MGKIAFLFAGQGAQYPGMGQDFYENHAVARAIFERLEKQRPGTIEQCFHGSKEMLSTTIYTQPCVFTVDYVIAKTVQESGISVDAVAGFSLGEIPALAFAGWLEESQAFALVCRRAEVMQEAAEAHPGSMQAILKLPSETITTLSSHYTEVFPVNYNSPEQTVVAGEAAQLKSFAADVKEAGGRAVPLAVSGAFHSPYMNSAAEKLRQYVLQLNVQEGWCPVYANKVAEPYRKETIASLIAAQVNHPVQWLKTIQQMIADGVDCFIEVGPGKTLSGLVKKISSDVSVYKIENTDDLKAMWQSISK